MIFYAAKVFLDTMKNQNGDWLVGNKLWNVLTPEQRKLILFQRYQHMNMENNNQIPLSQNQQQNNKYIPRKENSQIPPNLKVNDAIVKPPLRKEGTQNIPKQYKTNKVSNINSEENNNITVLEQCTGTGSIEEAYGRLCNINTLNAMWENGDQTQYFNCNNIIQCKAHIEYIARLSIHGGKKSLAIMDSGADTHVFGKGWIPLFTEGTHTPMADLIKFNNIDIKIGMGRQVYSNYLTVSHCSSPLHFLCRDTFCQIQIPIHDSYPRVWACVYFTPSAGGFSRLQLVFTSLFTFSLVEAVSLQL